MRQISVNRFRSQLKTAVDKVVHDHTPLRVTRRTGEDFVVVGAEEWERDQETLYVLQNSSLMRQIEGSLETHRKGKGYVAHPEELDASDRL